MTTFFAGSASNDLLILPHLKIVWPVRKSLHSYPVFIIIHFFQARRQPQGPSKAWETFSSALKNHLDGQDAEEAARFPADPTTTTEPKGMSSRHQLGLLITSVSSQTRSLQLTQVLVMMRSSQSHRLNPRALYPVSFLHVRISVVLVDECCAFLASGSDPGAGIGKNVMNERHL